MRRLIASLLLVFVTLVVAVCGSCAKWPELVAPIAHQIVEPGAIQFEAFDTLPTPLRHTLWHWPLRDHFATMQQCSGRSASFEQLEWFAFPEKARFRVGPRLVDGFWDGDRRIYLAGRPTTLSPPKPSTIRYLTARHEILHYLTKAIGHPDEYFGADGRCAVELELR